jgi:hypothetical protein
MPDQPFSMSESAVAIHELFVSLTAAGFTERQALYLIAQTVILGDQSQGEAP